MKLRTWMVVILICACPLVASGQETRGSIIGQVVDSSGAVVPGADVTVTNTETNVSVKDVTNSVGAYEVLYLLPGTYTLNVRKAGFKTTRQENIRVDINARVRLDFTLEVGTVNQQVAVTARAPLLDTASANLGSVLRASDVAELPVSYGNIYQVLYFTAGVAQIANNINSGDQNEMDANGSYITFNGTPMGTANWTVDGISNGQAMHGVGVVSSPPVDVVQEVKVETAFDASSGNTSGVVINVALKSGTNKLHGSGEFYDRPPYWASRPYFSTLSNTPRGPSYYKRWGGTFTGPVYLPKIYNGTNRTFFTYAYQADNEGNTATDITTVPTAAERQGDFSALLALGPQYQIYDPATIQPTGNGRYSRQPFVGNIIPSPRISPIATAILKHYPLPNQPGAVDGVNNWTWTNPAVWGPDKFHNHLAKIDHSFTDKQRLTGRFNYMYRYTGPYRQYWPDIAMGEAFRSYTHVGALDYTNTLSPSLVLDAGLSHSRWYSGHDPLRSGFDASTLGFQGTPLAQLQQTIKVFPTIGVSGLQTLAGEGYDLGTTDVAEYFVRLNKEHRTHDLKFGADIFHTNYNYFSPGSAGGSFSFGCSYDNGPLDNSPCAPSGGGRSGHGSFIARPTHWWFDDHPCIVDGSVHSLGVLR
jgi:hypothetical protein